MIAMSGANGEVLTDIVGLAMIAARLTGTFISTRPPSLKIQRPAFPQVFDALL
jgi:hypothetical protein